MTHSTCSLSAALLLLIGLSAPALAEAPGEKTPSPQEKKLEELENGPGGFTLAAGNKSLTISGLLEVETAYIDTTGRPAESDLNLATAQLNFDAAIADRIKGRIVLLHEEGEESDR